MRVRITFAKTDAMRYTGHLDLHRVWERTMRRAGLPLAYSQGFNPHPRLQLAAALPLGFTSECEVLDAWFEEPVPVSEVAARLEKASPPGIQLISINEVDLHEPALQTRVRYSEYVATLLFSVPDLAMRITRLLALPSIMRARRGKRYDLRPLVQELETLPEDDLGQASIRMLLSAQEGATGRPEEVLEALEIPPENARVHRTRLILEE